MGTIADKLNNILECKADIKSAIEEQGVTVGDAPLSEYAGKIEQISGGGAEEAPENDVNFYDYDGRRIASYTIEEAKALTKLPTPPSHEGLTFQEWNWSLSDIQTYDRQYIDVGANYITTDGKTWMKVRVTDTNVVMTLALNKGVVVVDWGDESESTVSRASAGTGYVSARHTYQKIDNYTIKMSFTPAGDSDLFGFRNHANSMHWYGMDIEELRCGNYFSPGITDRGISYLKKCVVSISTSTDLDNQYVFQLSYIPVIVVPKGSVFTYNSGFTSCYGVVSFPKKTSDYSGLAVNNRTMCSRMVIPECTNTSVILPYSALSVLRQVRFISIPLSLQWETRSTADFVNGCQSLEEIDIVQGWTPNQNIRFNYSNRWTVDGLVKFFTKLGTTSTAITLTFGATNLNKLTAEQKAIATDKGYTLA